jgi:signal transduction histidine kinase
VSKRPKTADSVMSRLRRPLGRLRDLPIWSKLGLIMIVPTLATIGVGTNGLIEHLGTANDADRARTLAQLTEASGALVHNLQNERAAAVTLLGARDEQAQKGYLDKYNKLHPTVDDTKRPYQQERNALNAGDLPTNFRNLLDRIDTGLAELPATRSQVTNARLTFSDASNDYTELLTALLSIRDSAAQLAGDSTLGDQMRSAAALARDKEASSQERVVVHDMLSKAQFTPKLRNSFIETQAAQKQAEQAFNTVATREYQELFSQTVAGPDERKAATFAGFLTSKDSATMSDVPFNTDTWDAAMVAKADLIRSVESQIDGDVAERATALRDDEYEQLLVEAGVLLGVLLLAILFAWAVARSMARSLRELRHGALSVAQYGLPQAVARLRDPQLSSQLSPVQVANQIAEPLPVRTKDEFGQVTEAFNAVHLEAVRTAAEQAALRASVATMFVNLARRSQILVDRLIGHLDRLERGEEDPDRLAELFQLDHLATRMRRNDENLLVLAGADSTRVQREPAALIDVLRAAQSEVEHYTRIEFGVVDRDIEVSANAVNDLVHLVAELFDNATAFSPPDSHVVVEARRVGDRAVLYVEDRGIGMSPDQLHDLNERLATPPMVDVAVSRMMGLVVVARLAARHGVKVELRPAADRGTVADVTLPTSVLVPRALSGRLQPGAPLPPPPTPLSQEPPAPPRPLFSAPLALESGSTGPIVPQQPGPSRSFEPAPLNGGGTPPGPMATPRSMPAWSDLTGASSAVNGTANGTGGPHGDMFSPRTPTNGQHSDPLPQRRGGDHWTVDGEVSGPAGNIPRQMPPPVSAPPARPVSGAPNMVPPVSGIPVSGTPMSAPPSPHLPPQHLPANGPSAMPPAAAPPAWPPVNTPDREAATPPVPEKLAAALDMTAELPKVGRPQPAGGASQPPATAAGANAAAAASAAAAAAGAKQRFADETMELPIFRELESAWFRTRRSTSEKPAAATPAPTPAPAKPVEAPTPPPAKPVETKDDFVTVDAGMVAAPVAARTGPPATGAPAGNGVVRPEASTSGWQTAADDGWRAATKATKAAGGESSETTQAGLPKRVPMAQLVPGGVDKGATSVQRRTPEAVRGLLSAYHRGVQRGRTHPKDEQPASPEANSTEKPPGAGAGPAAGNGQKEHE